MNTSRRRSSLSQSQQSGSQRKRPSLTASVRRSSQKLTQNTFNEINATLGRSIITDEAPSNKQERRQRRNSRKEDYARVKDVRSDRMGAVKGQWQSHRDNFVSEEEELENLIQKQQTKKWTCCGATLCCGW